MSTRTEQRETFPDAIRLRLLEGDMDNVFQKLDEIRTEQKRTNTLLIGILSTMATAGVLLAINVVVLGS